MHTSEMLDECQPLVLTAPCPHVSSSRKLSCLFPQGNHLPPSSKPVGGHSEGFRAAIHGFKHKRYFLSWEHVPRLCTLHQARASPQHSPEQGTSGLETPVVGAAPGTQYVLSKGLLSE